MKIKRFRQGRQRSTTMEREIARARSEFLADPKGCLFELLSAIRMNQFTVEIAAEYVLAWTDENTDKREEVFDWAKYVLRKPRDSYDEQLARKFYPTIAMYLFVRETRAVLFSLLEMIRLGRYREQSIAEKLAQWIVNFPDTRNRARTWAKEVEDDPHDQAATNFAGEVLRICEESGTLFSE